MLRALTQAFCLAAIAGFVGMGCATIPKPAQPTKPMQESLVTYLSGDLNLEGTLCLPSGADAGKVPAVVLAHGSGPSSRDGFMQGQLNMGFGFKIPVYAELAWALCDAGFATLRFDKRSCSKENKCYQNDYPLVSNDEIVIQDFMDDVLAGVTYLAEYEEIDKQHIFVVGHSQSAQFVPHLMDARHQIKAGVMLAAPYQPIDKALTDQLKSTDELLARLKIKKEFATSATGDLRQWVGELKSLREGSFEGKEIGHASTTFWKSWMDIGDQAPTLARTLRRPLLVLSGDYDWNVPTQETRDWEDWLKHNSRTQHQVMVVSNVTHALNEVHQREVTDINAEKDIERHVSLKVTKNVVKFLKEVIQIDQEESEARAQEEAHQTGKAATPINAKTPLDAKPALPKTNKEK